MKKYLIGIPVLYNSIVTKKAIDSVIKKENIDILIIDNGAEIDVKDVIYSYKESNLFIIKNETNMYVNYSWNQILEHFLKHLEYDYICIMNSDIIMQPQFNEVLENYHNINPNSIVIAHQINDITEITNKVDLDNYTIKVVTEGTAGVNIILNRKQAKIVYPIPGYINIWFGDNFIYEVLRELGYKTIILSNLVAYHYGSQNVSRLKGVAEIIEEDKRNWSLYSEQNKKDRVNRYKP